MGFLDDIFKAVQTFFSGRGIVQVTTPKEEREEISIFYRKIAKSGKSQQGNRALFAYTFERNQQSRFNELINAIEDTYETSLDSNIFGYDGLSTFQTVPFEYPEIEVGKE